jgi:hypothetical protein
MRDRASLESYFKTSAVQSGEPIDAQTLAGIANGSLDFVISAHLSNICAIQSAQSSAPFGSSSPAGSIYWSCPRCGELSIATGRKPVLRMCSPIFATAASAPAGTAARSILRYVHPILTGQRYSEAEIQRQATEAARLWPKYGAHFHAWTGAGFEALLDAASDLVPFRLIETASVVNENLFVLRKISAIELRIRRTWRRITTAWHDGWKKMG